MARSRIEDSLPEKDRRIAELVRILQEAEKELQELIGDDVDAVNGPTGQTLLLQEAQNALYKSEEKHRKLAAEQQAILDSLPAHVALLNAEGTIMAVNRSWERFARENGFLGESSGIGNNYLEICASAEGANAEEANDAGAGIRKMLAGEIDNFSLEYPCHAPHEKRWFRMVVTPIEEYGSGGVVVTHFDITERKLAELDKQRLVASLGERVKELGALHKVATFLRKGWNSIPEVLQAVTEVLSTAFQYPESVRVKITYGEDCIVAPDFPAQPRYRIHADFKTRDGREGRVEVANLGEDDGEKVFLDEEKVLLESVAEMLRASFEGETAIRALRDSEERYRLLFDKNPHPMWVYARGSLKFLAVNEAAVVNYGYSREEFLGMSIADIRPEEDIPALLENVATAPQGYSSDGFWQHRLKDGRIIQVEIFSHGIEFEGQSAELILAINVTERMQVEEVLRNREALLSSAQRIGNMGSWSVDLFNNQLTWSDETYRLFGIEPEDFDGSYEALQRMVHPDDRELMDTFHRKLQETEDVVEGEYRIIRPDGEVRWMYVRGQLEKDASGEAIGRIGMIMDITQRKDYEAELRLLGNSVAQLQDMVMITKATPVEEPGPEIVFVNKAAESITGYRADELIGRSPRILRGENIQADRRSRIREALERGEPVHEQLINRRKGGEEYWVDVSIHPIKDERGKVTHFVAVERDISDFKASMAYQNLLVAALNEAADPMFIADRKGAVEWVNNAFTRDIGYTLDEVKGKNAKELLESGIHEEAFFEQIRDVVWKGKVWSGEVVNHNKEGDPIEQQVTVTPISHEESAISHFIIVMRDVTEEKRREKQELRSQRMESIGNLAGGIAHDLNNVLAPILMSVELLNKREEDESRRKIIETIGRSASRGADLVRQVLTFSRGEEGEHIAVDLVELVEELDKMIQETFPKSIKYHSRLADNLWTVHADRTQLHQVLMNLCINARDAMPNGGELKLDLKNTVIDEDYSGMNPNARAGACVMISIEDTGSGIPKAIQNQIFDPFFTTKATGKGTGLGLSTCHRIIKDHGGFINFYTEQGKGTVFKVYLPAVAGREAMEKTARSESGLPGGHGEWILVVDDEANLREIVKKTLERFGYHVDTAANGAEAVALYSRDQSKYQVVITDMAMPVMDGYSTILALRSINADVKIIGSSGQGSNGGVARALGAGVEYFIPKPYTAESMLRALYQVLHEEEAG